MFQLNCLWSQPSSGLASHGELFVQTVHADKDELCDVRQYTEEYLAKDLMTVN